MECNNYALCHLDVVKIQEVVETGDAIVVVFILLFKDGSIVNYQHRIKKDEVHIGSINAMVL